MSVDISVGMPEAIEIEWLLREARAVLAEILSVPFVPPLTACEYAEGRKLPLEMKHVTRSSNMILIEVEGKPGTIALIVSSNWDSYDCPQRLVDVASIQMLSGRTSLTYALAAAIALCIARKFSTKIRDFMPFFVSELDSSAAEFFDSLRVSSPAENVDEAAISFQENLYVERSCRTR